jgi:hypothetical protein
LPYQIRLTVLTENATSGMLSLSIQRYHCKQVFLKKTSTARIMTEMARLKVIGSQLKFLWNQFLEVKHVWIPLCVIIVALALCLRACTSEPWIRMAGLVLQLFGILTVIWGISETRALFGHPSLARKAKDWINKCLILQRPTVINASAASVVAAGCKANIHTTHGPGDNPSIESRVDSLEKNIGALREQIDNTRQEIDLEINKTADRIASEEQLRVSGDKAISEKLEATGTGGVHISAIGAVFLFFGVILSTVSAEIADYRSCEVGHTLLLTLTYQIGH